MFSFNLNNDDGGDDHDDGSVVCYVSLSLSSTRRPPRIWRTIYLRAVEIENKFLRTNEGRGGKKNKKRKELLPFKSGKVVRVSVCSVAVGHIRVNAENALIRFVLM